MILSTFLAAVANIIHMVIQIYIWVIIISALLSWVRPDPYNPIVQLLYRLTEPAYSWVRGVLRKIFKRDITIISGIDITPIAVLLLLQFIDLFFVRLLLEFAASI